MRIGLRENKDQEGSNFKTIDCIEWKKLWHFNTAQKYKNRSAQRVN